jgi:hypothetical protein
MGMTRERQLMLKNEIERVAKNPTADEIAGDILKDLDGGEEKDIIQKSG